MVTGLARLKGWDQTILTSASTWANKIVDLIVVCVFQTLLVPVGMLWRTWRQVAQPRQTCASHRAADSGLRSARITACVTGAFDACVARR
jgi:hypothetical protein